MRIAKVRAIFCASILASAAALAQGEKATFDPAAAFGARPSVTDLSLSPDGLSIAYISPLPSGQGSVLYTMRLDAAPKAVPAFAANGKPFRLSSAGGLRSMPFLDKGISNPVRLSPGAQVFTMLRPPAA